MKLTKEDLNKYRKDTINYLKNEVTIKKGRNYYSVYCFTQKQVEWRLNLLFQLTDKELKDKINPIFKKFNFTYKQFKEAYK